MKKEISQIYNKYLYKNYLLLTLSIASSNNLCYLSFFELHLPIFIVHQLYRLAILTMSINYLCK